MANSKKTIVESTDFFWLFTVLEVKKISAKDTVLVYTEYYVKINILNYLSKKMHLYKIY
jgi:hypothetical protein